jgi:hypothetical protein
MTMLRTEQKEVGWSFGLQWVGVTIAGMVAGGMLALPIGYGLGEQVGNVLGEGVGFFVTGLLFGICLGGGIGLGQWVLLRPRLGRADLWALTSAIGGAVGLGVAFPVLISINAVNDPGPLAELLLAAFFGLPVGIGQWFILRGQVARSGWWVVICGAALALGLLAGLQFDGEGREVLAFTIAGLGMGAGTGAGMVWLLREQKE